MFVFFFGKKYVCVLIWVCRDPFSGHGIRIETTKKKKNIDFRQKLGEE